MQITATSFRGVLQRLGIIPYPAEGFKFADTVVPVSLVDSDITLQATAAPPLLDTPASAGELTAPAAGTRLADTGPQSAGNYLATIMYGNSAAENTIRIRRRNAADASDVWSIRAQIPVNLVFLTIRVVLQPNERLVVENVGGGGAGVVYNADIWLTAS